MKMLKGSMFENRHRAQARRKDSGFTLIELLVVVVILGLLIAIALFFYRKYVYRAELITAVADINAMEKVIYGYTIDYQGGLPPNLAVVNYGGFEDPWGNLYVYQPDLSVSPRTRAGSNINNDYDLYSVGLDGLSAQDIDAPNSLDDVIRAENGNYKGLSERY